MSNGPLNGIRILEVEAIGPGPFAAMMLADLGADVIVVHRPRTGPLPGLKDKPLTDRGKRSILLDLKSEADRETFLRLAARADGLIEGFRPGVMERLGLGPKECQKVNPRLVYGRMTGWGQDGPQAPLAGHDLNYLALAGALWSAALPHERPSVPPTLLGDIGGGALYLVTGMLAGFLAAERSGSGTVVDAAIFDGAAHLQNLLLSVDGSTAGGPPARSNPLVGAHWSRTYRCADDRFVSVQCLEPKFYLTFLERMGLEDDADFLANQFTPAAWPRLADQLSARFAEHPLHYWEALFQETDACVAPVLSPEESFWTPHNHARQTWHETEDGLQAVAAPRFSGWPVSSPPPVPDRGQHSAEIMAELASEFAEVSQKKS
ncbi:CaiB/BaiF CoA transferase family protein [Pseudohalocynthiibacter aestuariivivens]|uniref:CaiB/BaiF CoA transferase family protein n=1 Tax=Pseudohalocynthiibacter aestuariivivens TaxID=1591409 RepID=A0ABV5JK82_9RHOB|nr:CaiB/BaiF CoA-transferase family protein [Pseudohalocynthiibacter aestuariivivens]MBS9716526.1 CoA transferase [Pseudohalocynthiibacter aestuariivivens]